MKKVFVVTQTFRADIVNYYTIEAESEKEALELAKSGDLFPDDTEVDPFGDHENEEYEIIDEYNELIQ